MLIHKEPNNKLESLLPLAHPRLLQTFYALRERDISACDHFFQHRFLTLIRHKFCGLTSSLQQFGNNSSIRQNMGHEKKSV